MVLTCSQTRPTRVYGKHDCIYGNVFIIWVIRLLLVAYILQEQIYSMS